MASQQPRPMGTNYNEQGNSTTNFDGLHGYFAGDGGGGSIPPISSFARQQSFYSLSAGNDYQGWPPQSNSTTNGNGLICDGGGGGGGGSILPASSLATQESIFSLSGVDYQRYIKEPNMIPNVNSNGALAPGLLRQMGVPFAPSFPLQTTAASQAGGSGHSNGLSLPPVGNYGGEGSMGGRKMQAEDLKAFERKQKRLIKNRESAEKSRGRSKAYVSDLKQENERLKKTNELQANEIARLKEEMKAKEDMTKDMETEIARLKEEIERLTKNAKEDTGLGGEVV